jgi:hypothetical protein
MNVNRQYIKVILNEEDLLVNLKWFRGANRYNNGCTRYGRKYYFRLVMSWAKGYAAKCDKI